MGWLATALALHWVRHGVTFDLIADLSLRVHVASVCPQQQDGKDRQTSCWEDWEDWFSVEPSGLTQRSPA